MSRHRGLLDDLAADVTPRVLAEALEEATSRARAELADQLTRAIVDQALGARDTAAPESAAASPAEPVTEQSEPHVEPRQPQRETPRPADRLVDDPADEPVDRSVAPPANPSVDPSVGDPSVPPTPTRDDTGLYAFAIMPARPVDLAGVPGIDGVEPLRIVQHGELGLVVSRMRMDLMADVNEEDLSETSALAVLARRHDEVVRKVFDLGPVLPLRFGTVVADEDGAHRLLEYYAAAARRRLAHLDTHREWGVRLTREEPGADADTTEQDRAERAQMSGTSYLAARRDALQRGQRAEQETAALVQRVEDALSEYAVDLAQRGGPGSGALAEFAYLVPEVRQSAFLDAVEGLRKEVADEHLLLDLTGPWPPYSFATLDTAPTDRGVVGSA
ncbi:MAG: GvpL/GvpF family gas vesicle protein [Nocardioidaceae bacterium]